MSNANNTFAHTLRQFRQNSGLSLRELSHQSEFSEAYLSLLENGKRQPSYKAVKQLAECLALKLVDYEQLIQAAGYEENFRPAQFELKQLSFEELLFQIHDTYLRHGSNQARELITVSLSRYPHPVCLQLMVVFLEAVQNQHSLAWQAFSAARQAFKLQPEAFANETFLYAEMLLHLCQQPIQPPNQALFDLLEKTPDTPQKYYIEVFLYTAAGSQYEQALVQAGQNLLQSLVSTGFQLPKQQAILHWLTHLQYLPQQQTLLEHSLATLLTFDLQNQALLNLRAHLISSR